MRVRISSAAAFVILTAACAPTQSANQAPVPVAKFHYADATACVAPASVPVTFAVVSPQFKDVPQGMLTDQGETSQLLFSEFPKAMRAEFISGLNCKGFATKGPFANYDDMVFPDRQGADLILSPEIDLKYSLSEVTPKSAETGVLGALTVVSGTAPTSFRVDGKVTVGGRVTLSLRESLTNTRMWSKTVELDPSTTPFTGEGVYSAAALQAAGTNGVRLAAYNDAGSRRVLVPMLEQYYTKILSTAMNYMDAQDMELVKRQSIAVRKAAQATIAK